MHRTMHCHMHDNTAGEPACIKERKAEACDWPPHYGRLASTGSTLAHHIPCSCTRACRCPLCAQHLMHHSLQASTQMQQLQVKRSTQTRQLQERAHQGRCRQRSRVGPPSHA